MLHLEHTFLAKRALFLLNAAWIYGNLFLVAWLMGFGGNRGKQLPVSCALSVSAYLSACYDWKVTERV